MARTPSKHEKVHIHIQELPKGVYPRNSLAEKYSGELLRAMSGLRFTNEKVQYSSQICDFNIASIGRKNNFIPEPTEVFRQIQGFVYHYENFCFRTFAFREKLLQFLNAVFSLNFPEGDVKYRYIKISPTVIAAKLVKMLETFEDDESLGKTIKDRNSLTHRLYYGETFNHYLQPISPVAPEDIAGFKKWSKSWRKEIMSRAKLANACIHAVYDINHELAEKVLFYKQMHAKKVQGKRTKKANQ